MMDELQQILADYLSGDSDLETLSDWIALNIRHCPDIEDCPVEWITLEMWHFQDGVIDEAEFRAQVAEVLAAIPSFQVPA